MNETEKEISVEQILTENKYETGHKLSMNELNINVELTLEKNTP